MVSMKPNDSILPEIEQSVKNELNKFEEIHYIEQPVGHRFRLSLLWDYNAALLYLSLLFFITNWKNIQADIGHRIIASLFLAGTVLIVAIAIIIWINARRTVYVITNQRAFILHLQNGHAHIMNFSPEQINIRMINKHATGAGDIIFCRETRSDAKGNPVDRHYGFKSVPDVSEMEIALDKLTAKL